MHLKIFCDKADVLTMDIVHKLHEFGYRMEIVFVGRGRPLDDFFSFYSRRILGPFVQLYLCEPRNIRRNFSASSSIAFLSPHYSFSESDLEVLNTMDYILISNPIVREKLIRHGVGNSASVRDIQCFYDTLALEKANTGNYTFMFHADWDKSNGWQEMLFSYCNEFTDGEADIIISTKGDSRDVNMEVERFLLLNNFKRSDYGGIYVITDKELSDVLKFADCFIAPYLNNVYDQNILTVMRCGIPLIINRLNAYQSFCRKNTCWVIDFISEGVVNTLEMSSSMRKVFEEREKAVEKANIAKQFLINTFGKEDFYEQVISVIREAGVEPLSIWNKPLTKWGNVI